MKVVMSNGATSLEHEKKGGGGLLAVTNEYWLQGSTA